MSQPYRCSWHQCHFKHTVTAVFSLAVQKLRRESAHARTFGGDFELKILHMRAFSSRFLDNQPENCYNTCTYHFLRYQFKCKYETIILPPFYHFPSKCEKKVRQKILVNDISLFLNSSYIIVMMPYVIGTSFHSKEDYSICLCLRCIFHRFLDVFA